MDTKKITSLQHPLVKHWVQLRLERPYREETKRLFVSGEKMARELPIETLITVDPSDIPAKEKYLVTPEILKKITGLVQPDGFAGELPMPEPQDLSKKQFLIILDQIADPGNLGTLLRTALALNWEGVILTPGTVDLFNDKVLRSAKGAHFHLPYARMTPEDIAKLKLHFYTADLNGESLDQATFKTPMALILSSEAHGPSRWAHPISRKVTIPMNPKSESLNVAISGAILLYAMRLK
jgi:TrmH family RNA methyltransferase